MTIGNKVRVLSCFRDKRGSYLSAQVEWANGVQGFYAGPESGHRSIDSQQISAAVITVDAAGENVACLGEVRSCE